MTPQGVPATSPEREFVLNQNAGPLKVVRRLRLDASRGLMRFAEIVENPGNETATVELQLQTDLEQEAAAVLDERGNDFSPQEGKATALVAVNPGAKPGAVFIFGGPRARAVPEVSVENNRRIRATYRFELPPAESAVVLHYVAQRQNAAAADARVVLKKLIRSGKIVDEALPPVVEGRLLNFSETATAVMEPPAPLEELTSALDALRLNRGSEDFVVFDTDTRITGAITGSDLEVDTAFGSTKVPFHDIAAIAGGAGAGRLPRIFLRNGEVLVGKVTRGDFTQTSPDGLKVRPKIEQLLMMVFHAEPDDGKPSGDVTALLSTHRGECLAVAAANPFQIAATTAWGALRLPLDQVHQVAYVRQPFPSHRFVLRDGSRFVAMLATEEWPVSTTRFGQVKIVPQTVRKLRALSVPQQPSEAVSFAQIIGDYRLRGSIDLPALHVAQGRGVTPVATDSILKLTREADDQDNREVVIEQASGEKLQGKLTERVIPLRAGDRVWRVPLSHLESYEVSQPASPQSSPSPTSP